MTGSFISSAINLARPGILAPPPAIVRPALAISDKSSGGVSSIVSEMAAIIWFKTGVIASRIWEDFSFKVVGKPVSKLRPETVISFSAIDACAAPIVIFNSSAVRSPIKML